MRHGVWFAILLLTGCGGDSGVQVRFFAADAYPERLSEWGLYELTPTELVPAPDAFPYDLNTPLFTDYAQKLRTIWMPPGTSAVYDDYDSFEFPVGTIISKTFFYPETAAGLVRTSFDGPAADGSLKLAGLKLMETRLLVKQADGWDALPYVWRGNDAYLKLAGDLEMLEIELPDGEVTRFPYIVPTRNQCASCHATNHTSGELMPIGPKARHLNRAFLPGQENQLEGLVSAGRLVGLPELDSIAANARLDDPAAAADVRARAYLDINCGHCHNDRGAADTSGLLLDAAVTSSRQLGLCKPPIAAGGGTGGRSYSIVPGAPDESILIYRLETTDPGTMMPELGRSLSHREGVALLEAWVAGMDGECIEVNAD